MSALAANTQTVNKMKYHSISICFWKSCKQEYYQTPDGKTEKIPILTYEIDGKSENVYAAQDEDIKEFKEIIDNVKIVQRKDSPIIGIVQAEALYYFDGQKSMKETIDTMKNRIEIYEKENSY